jgi:tRNA(Ile)-lysidine synthase
MARPSNRSARRPASGVQEEGDPTPGQSKQSPAPDPIEQLLAKKLARWGIDADELLAVGVSGGADSTALLVALAKVHPKLHVLHVNHGLRKAASADAAFVRRLAKKLQLPCTMICVKIPAGGNLEARARAARQSALHDTTLKLKAAGLLLAHHQGDVAETLLINLLRGAGARGLGGLRAKRTLRVNGGKPVTVLRPLLAVSRKRLHQYLLERDQPWREDESNRNGNLRARLRHELMPLLDRLAGRDAAPLLARSAGLLAADDRLLRFLAKENAGEADPLELSALRVLPAPLRHRLLLRAFRAARPGAAGLSLIHLRAADRLIYRGRTGQQIPWPGDWRLLREKSRLRLVKFRRPK